MAGAYLSSGIQATPVSQKEAAFFVRKGCDLGLPTSCAFWGRFLAHGNGTQKNVEEAERVLSKACESKNNKACHELAKVVASTSPDLQQKLLTENCDRADGPSCTDLGDLFAKAGVNGNDPKANELYERACFALKDGKGCLRLAAALHVDSQAQQPAPVMKALEASCEYGEEIGCVLLGQTQEVLKHYRAAADAYRKGCALENYESCNVLGYMYARGTGVLRDGKEACHLFETACRAGYYNACDSLGEAREKGWGGKVDLGAAYALYEQACRELKKESGSEQVAAIACANANRTGALVAAATSTTAHN